LAHWKSVSALAIDPTGQTLVSASHDGTIKLWDLHQGQCITTLSRSKGQIWDLAISNDGQWLVVGGTNPRLQVWNLATRKVEQSLGDLFSGHRDPVRVVEFSADDQLIFSAGVKRSCKCWHRASGNLAYQLKALTVPLTTIAPSPQGNLLAVSGTNQRLQIRDLPTGALLQEMTLSHSGLVLQFSPNGRLLAIGLANGEIQIYTVDDTGQRGEPWQRAFSLPGHRANVSALIFSPDGTVLTSSGWDGTIKSWDLQTQRAVCTARGHQDDQIMALALSGDGKTLVSGGADRQICLWYRGLPNF
jgi:WD40 repeat protein